MSTSHDQREHQLTLMAVHAHPDDEGISTGGVLARAAAEGMRAVVVCATRGEEGEIRDPDLDPEEARGRLGEIREGELRRACAILGVEDVEILGFHDSGMAGTPANESPEAFCNVDPEEAARRLVGIIRRLHPDVVVTYDEKGGYGHPDHIATHRMTVRAVEAAADPECFPAEGAPWQVAKLYYLAWSRSDIRIFQQALLDAGQDAPFGDEFVDIYGVDDDDITTRVDVRPYVGLQRDSLRAHRTQIPEGDPFLAAPDDLAEYLLGTETFMRIASTVPVPEKEDDLFVGLR